MKWIYAVGRVLNDDNPQEWDWKLLALELDKDKAEQLCTRLDDFIIPVRPGFPIPLLNQHTRGVYTPMHD